MATPFIRESKRHQPLLGMRDLADVLDLVERHGYSGVSYKRLGLSLGLSFYTLESIESNYRGDVSRCLTECLVAWLRREDNVDSVGGPTYDTLIKALRKMGENAVADGIERESGTGTAATLQAPSFPPPTVVSRTNPNELSIADLMIVLTVLSQAMFGPLRWMDLGLSLGLLMSTLNVIGRTNGDANDHLKLTLQYWLEKKDKVKGTTWDNLISAVKSTGDNAAAERIPGILRSSTMMHFF